MSVVDRYRSRNFHDSAAALVWDGEVVAAAEEERFSRRKHDASLPSRSIDCCLREAFIDPSQLDAVVFYDNPLLTLDRVVKSAARSWRPARDPSFYDVSLPPQHQVRTPLSRADPGGDALR